MNIVEFRRLTRNISRSLVEIEKENVCCCGLPLMESHIIIELNETPNISLNNLSTLLKIDKSQLSKTIQKLFIKGLVNREQNTTDRREVSLSLTLKGIDLVQSINTEMSIISKKILDDFSEEEQKQLYYYLNKLDKSLNKQITFNKSM